MLTRTANFFDPTHIDSSAWRYEFISYVKGSPAFLPIRGMTRGQRIEAHDERKASSRHFFQQVKKDARMRADASYAVLQKKCTRRRSTDRLYFIYLYISYSKHRNALPLLGRASLFIMYTNFHALAILAIHVRTEYHRWPFLRKTEPSLFLLLISRISRGRLGAI